MYDIVITDRAEADIEKLNPSIKRRIGEKLKQYAADPYHYATKINRIELGTFRFRIGDYRVIFDIESETIIVLRVGHRSKIYE